MESAMRLTEIRKHVEQEPFRPFRVCMSDGAAYEVRNPNLIYLSTANVVIGVLVEGEEFPDESHYCDPVHIVRVETLPTV